MKTFKHPEGMSKIIDLGGKVHLLCPQAKLYLLTYNMNRRPTEYHKIEWLGENSDGYSVNLFNYTQIFKKTIDNIRTIEDRAYARKKKTIEMARDINRAFYYGIRSEDVTHKTMGGLEFFLPKEEWPVDITTEEDFSILLKKVAKASVGYCPYVFSNTKFLDHLVNDVLHGSGLGIFHTDYLPVYYTETNADVHSGNKKIYFIADDHIAPTDLFIVKLDNLVYRPFKERDFQVIVEDGYYDVDGEFHTEPRDIVFCECSLEVHETNRQLKVTMV